MKRSILQLAQRSTTLSNSLFPRHNTRNKENSLEGYMSEIKINNIKKELETPTKRPKIRLDKLVIKKKNNTCLKKIIPMKINFNDQKSNDLDLYYQSTDETSLPIIKSKPVSKKEISVDLLRNTNENKKPSEESDKNLILKLKTFTKQTAKSIYMMKTQEGVLEEMNALKISNIGLDFKKYGNSRTSSSSSELIKAYAVNSFQGIVRSYNEDRVSIIIKIAQPKGYLGTWPACSYFAVYDGHGGSKCCDFLRDKLQDYIIKNKHFPNNPRNALISGIEQAEKDFLDMYALDDSEQLVDKSGSCSIVALIVDDICYVANVGDSRMVVSTNKGRKISVITTDHKPNEENESKRIKANGGVIYQGHSYLKIFVSPKIINEAPYRVFPGGLAVSRTIGDIESKFPSLGGKANVVIATPEISQFKIDRNTDFFMIGCDGIFDCLSNEECVECAWITMKSKKYAQSLHSKCGAVVDMILKSALKRKTSDNVTSIFVAFDSFERAYKKRFLANVPLNNNNNEQQSPIGDSGVKEGTASNFFSKHPEIKLKLKTEMVVSS